MTRWSGMERALLARDAARGGAEQRRAGEELQPVVATIAPLRVQRTDPPLYTATVDGRPLDLTLNELTSFPLFKRRCVAALGLVPRLLVAEGGRDAQVRAWDAILADALASATVEEAPEDASRAG